MAKKNFDYHQKNLKNPFRPKSRRKKKENRVKKIKLFSFFVLFFLIFIFLGWFLLFCDFWHIKNIKTSGLNRIPETEILDMSHNFLQGKKLLFIPKHNILFLNSEKLSEKIKDKYHFQNIEINKNLPDKLRIKITENTCAYILKQGNKYYQVDKNNYIIGKSKKIKDKSDFDDFPLIEDQGEITSKNKSEVKLNSNYLDYIQSLKTLIKKEDKFKIDKFILDQEYQTDLKSNLIKMKLKSGPIIYFSGEETPEKQVEKLLLVKNKLGAEFNNKQYITLEYGDRIFYK